MIKHILRLHALALRGFFTAATYLTPREQWALFLIITLFAIGTIVRYFRLLGITH